MLCRRRRTPKRERSRPRLLLSRLPAKRKPPTRTRRRYRRRLLLLRGRLRAPRRRLRPAAEYRLRLLLYRLHGLPRREHRLCGLDAERGLRRLRAEYRGLLWCREETWRRRRCGGGRRCEWIDRRCERVYGGGRGRCEAGEDLRGGELGAGAEEGETELLLRGKTGATRTTLKCTGWGRRTTQHQSAIGLDWSELRNAEVGRRVNKVVSGKGSRVTQARSSVGYREHEMREHAMSTATDGNDNIEKNGEDIGSETE